ncbi:MAG: YihA family ribosome biogenesis GTP-binding protein [Quinella sp. 3Q1]|nr:YihA family ribosome biogenesis GTP-binding protein [Quinella sp. 3Q1]MBR6888547.1 YihA family ribosome biogenesis GTP-binding protein [Selenomonadaceae bacterium]
MEEIKIIKSEYVTSAVSRATCPEELLPEIVFVGRSNVGKSSLINSLTNRKSLARTSGTPGKTQTINFFKVTLNDRREFYLVDLPGYGYAKTSKTNRRLWAKFIDEYLSSRRDIKFVCQLIDMRHPPQESDLKSFASLVEKNLPVLVIATKSDKIGKTQRQKHLDAIKNSLGVDADSILPYSSVKNEGRSDLLDVVINSLIK